EIGGIATVTPQRVEVLGAVMPDPDGGEMKPESRGTIDGLVGASTHPDWEVLLNRRRRDLDSLQMVVFPLERQLLAVEQTAENLHALFHSPGAVFVADASRVELVRYVALTNTQIEAPVGHDVHRRSVFRYGDRIVQRQEHDEGPDTNSLRPGRGAPGNCHERRGITVSSEVMLGQPCVTKT